MSGSSFENRDRIGIYVADYLNGNATALGQNNNAANTMHTFDGAGWVALQGEELYFRNENTEADIYAYYPYDPEISKANGKTDLSAYPFTVNEDQRDSYTVNDFLWAKATKIYPTGTPVDLIFKHSLSRITIVLNSDTELTDGTISSLFIHNLKNNCLIDMNNGQVTVTGQEARISPYKEDTDGRQTIYYAMIVPQSMEANTPLFSIEINGTRYIHEIAESIGFLPQKDYRFDMNLEVSNLRSTAFTLLNTEVRDL